MAKVADVSDTIVAVMHPSRREGPGLAAPPPFQHRTFVD